MDPGASRDQVPDDDVLLQLFQVVDGATHGGIRQHTGRLLEGGGADKRPGGEAGLRDSKQERLSPSRLFAGLASLDVRVEELDTIDVLALEESGIAGIDDAYLL